MSSARPELSATAQVEASGAIDVSSWAATWRARAVLASAVLGTILLGLGAWLLVPRDLGGGSPTLPALRICLVDVSASAIWRRSSFGPWVHDTLAAQAQEADRAGEELCAIVYDDEVRRVYGPGLAKRFLDAAGHASSLAEFAQPSAPMKSEEGGEAGFASRLGGALEAASDLIRAPGRGPCRVVLVGDGTYTGTDPLPLLREQAELGAVLERHDLPAPDVPEVVPGPLTLPSEVEVGAPIAASFELFYCPGRDLPERFVALTARLEFATGRTETPLRIPVPGGLAPDEDGYLRWHVRADLGTARSGWNRVRILGLPEQRGGSDVDPGTTSEGVVQARGSVRVGLVTSGSVRSFPYAPAPELFGTGIDLETLWPDQLGERIDDLDAVITCDVSPQRLPRAVLADFVRRGGGWLVFLGDDSLRTFQGGDLSALDLLPLRLRTGERRARDVVFLVDRSGSIAGEPTENVLAALLALVDLAPPEDAVELRWFSDHLSQPVHTSEIFHEKRPQDREALRRALADRVYAARGPGGPTALVQSLAEFAAAREKSGREALVFLLTDGLETTHPDPGDACAALRERLTAAHVRLVVIAAGEGSDRGLLARLVGPIDRLEEAGSIVDSSAWMRLESIFRAKLDDERVRTGVRLAVLPAEALLDPSSEPTIAGEIVNAQPKGWPPIQTFLRAEASPDAEVLWVSERADPLLAIRRSGLGMIAACASAPARGWAEAWRERGDLFAPLLRVLSRGKPPRSPQVRLEGDVLLVEDLPRDTPALLEADVFFARAREGDPPAARLLLSAPVEGDPRHQRSGAWPVFGRGSPELVWDELQSDRERDDRATARVPWVEIRAPDDPDWAPLTLPFALPGQVEFRLPRARIPAGSLGDLSGGDLVGETRPRAASPGGRPHPAAGGVLLSGLLLLCGAGIAGFFARRAL